MLNTLTKEEGWVLFSLHTQFSTKNWNSNETDFVQKTNCDRSSPKLSFWLHTEMSAAHNFPVELIQKQKVTNLEIKAWYQSFILWKIMCGHVS